MKSNFVDTADLIIDENDCSEQPLEVSWHWPALAGAFVLLGPTAIPLAAGYAIAKVLDK